MSAKTIADVLDLGSRYSENGINDYIAYRYSDLKQALIELVRSNQVKPSAIPLVSSPLTTDEIDLLAEMAAREARDVADLLATASRDQETRFPFTEALLDSIHERLDTVFTPEETWDDIEIVVDVDTGGHPGPPDILWTSFWEQKP